MKRAGERGGFIAGRGIGGGVGADGDDAGANLEGVVQRGEEVEEEGGVSGGTVLFRGLAIEEEFLFRTGEGDVEDVEAVHVGFAFFVVVLVVEERGFALKGVDEAGREREMGGRGNFDPDAVEDVAFVEDGVEDDGGFKSFSLVDGHEADGVEVGGGGGGESVFLIVEP